VGLELFYRDRFGKKRDELLHQDSDFNQNYLKNMVKKYAKNYQLTEDEVIKLYEIKLTN
jgi:hypothetical protein